MQGGRRLGASRSAWAGAPHLACVVAACTLESGHAALTRPHLHASLKSASSLNLLLWACPSGAARRAGRRGRRRDPGRGGGGRGRGGRGQGAGRRADRLHAVRELPGAHGRAVRGARPPPGPLVQLLQQGGPCTHRPGLGCTPNTQLIMQVSRTSAAAARRAAAGCARRGRAAPAVSEPLRMSGCGTLVAAGRPQLHACMPRA